MNLSSNITVALLLAGALSPVVTSEAADSLIPQGMVYVRHGPSVMGIDKEVPVSKKATPYERRMNTPWSANALTDESPAHMVFLDSYLIDKYEVSNQQYGDFIRSKGHPAPAYWDDPRLNKPEQPVVGVNWEDANAYCEFRGKRLPTEAEWEKAARGPHASIYPWGNEFDPSKPFLWPVGADGQSHRSGQTRLDGWNRNLYRPAHRRRKACDSGGIMDRPRSHTEDHPSILESPPQQQLWRRPGVSLCQDGSA